MVIPVVIYTQTHTHAHTHTHRGWITLTNWTAAVASKQIQNILKQVKREIRTSLFLEALKG